MTLNTQLDSIWKSITLILVSVMLTGAGFYIGLTRELVKSDVFEARMAAITNMVVGLTLVTKDTAILTAKNTSDIAALTGYLQAQKELKK